MEQKKYVNPVSGLCFWIYGDTIKDIVKHMDHPKAAIRRALKDKDFASQFDEEHLAMEDLSQFMREEYTPSEAHNKSRREVIEDVVYRLATIFVTDALEDNDFSKEEIADMTDGWSNDYAGFFLWVKQREQRKLKLA